MSATSPNPTQFNTSQPGGSGDHTPHTKIAFGAGTGASGTVTNVADATGERLPVGGALIGTAADTSAVASLLGRLLKLSEQLPATLTAGGNLRNEIMVDNSGVPTGQAAMASSVPVVIASDQTPLPGQTPYSLLCGASTNETSVKATPGTLLGGSVSNENTATRWLKIYDKASAPISSDTPKYRVMVPGGAHVMLGEMLGKTGANMALGIGFRTTTGRADADTGAVGATDLVVNLTYR